VRRLVLPGSVALALLGATGGLFAQGITKGADPLEMTADRLELDLEAKTATLTGHVKLTRGPLAIACEHLDARYDQVPHVTWARATGGVTLSMQGATAEAPELELDLASRTAVLAGGVRIGRGQGWIAAERATVQLDSGKIAMNGVRGVLPMGSAEPVASPAASR
jgi:lipopolysaccharide export system protein LptA